MTRQTETQEGPLTRRLREAATERAKAEASVSVEQARKESAERRAGSMATARAAVLDDRVGIRVAEDFMRKTRGGPTDVIAARLEEARLERLTRPTEPIPIVEMPQEPQIVPPVHHVEA